MNLTSVLEEKAVCLYLFIHSLIKTVLRRPKIGKDAIHCNSVLKTFERLKSKTE